MTTKPIENNFFAKKINSSMGEAMRNRVISLHMTHIYTQNIQRSIPIILAVRF